MKNRKTYQTGLAAEVFCMIWLTCKGYSIRAWRFRSYSGEIDIIAQRGKIIAFVEVKARPDKMTGMESVSVTSQRRIENAAADYIQRKANRAKFGLRFDLMIVSPRRLPVHIMNAW